MVASIHYTVVYEAIIETSGGNTVTCGRMSNDRFLTQPLSRSLNHSLPTTSPKPISTMSEKTYDANTLFTCLSCSIAFHSAEDQRTYNFSAIGMVFI